MTDNTIIDLPEWHDNRVEITLRTGQVGCYDQSGLQCVGGVQCSGAPAGFDAPVE